VCRSSHIWSVKNGIRRNEREREKAHLDVVVDEPLQGGEGTDHGDTDGKTVGGELEEAELAVDGAGSGLDAVLASSVKLWNDPSVHVRSE
jgi:hypothetical protein